MKTNNKIIEPLIDKAFYRNFHALTIDKVPIAMKEARIDTLLHLKDQMTVNAKKLSGESCVKLVEQLIEEIKKS